MSKIYPFWPQSLIGLDVQGDAARLVQLKNTRRGHQIERIAMQPMPADIFAAGKIQRWEELSLLLAEWFAALGLNQQRVAISLPLHAVRIQRIVMPHSADDVRIRAEIMTYMQQEMTGLNEPLSIDYSILPSTQVGCVDVLFTAVRETYLASYVDCVRMAGLGVKIVDVDVYALMRAMHVKQMTYAVLHVKTHITELFIFHQEEVIFHRQWETGDLAVWVEQLNAHLQTYFALANKKQVEKIAISGAEEYVNEVMLHSFLRDYTNIIINISIRDIGADYLVAYGLAVRKIPIW